jgi:hypothetical protein
MLNLSTNASPIFQPKPATLAWEESERHVRDNHGITSLRSVSSVPLPTFMPLYYPFSSHPTSLPNTFRKTPKTSNTDSDF